MNCNNSYTITVKKMVNGGYGLAANHEGKTVFVRHGLPGETIRAATIDKLERHDFARVVKILEPHPNRIEPPCRYYRNCGGCDFQHVDYQTQCNLKKQIIVDLLQRNVPSLKTLTQKVSETLPSPEAFGYRQRIRLKTNVQGRLGFTRFRSHDIVPVNKCLLAPEIINNCLAALQNIPAFAKLSTTVKELEILRDPSNETVCIMLHLNRKPRPADRTSCHLLAEQLSPGTRVFLCGSDFATEGPYCLNDVKTDNILSSRFRGLTPLVLSWEAGGFCQVNLDQNQQLIKMVYELLVPSPSDHILDLYCGMGNFSLPLAISGAQVHGIESQGSAIRSAKRNSETNNLSNVVFTKSGVPSACRELVKSGKTFDTIICDPPRQGLADMPPVLARLTNNRVIYISCDPATLCRDLAALISEGFTVKKIQPVDMFPQTHHIETVTLLEKE